MIRPATVDDAPAIRAIWNDLIRNTTVTFNSVQKAEPEVADFLACNPVFVADVDGVAGYASYGAFRGGIGYARIAEHSIVLTAKARRQGFGRALMDQIAAHAKARNINSLIAAISAENTGGQAFHARLGFVEVGRIPQAGFKFDRWITLVLMQKHL